MTPEDVDKMFSDIKYQSASGRTTVSLLRTSASMLAQHINDHCPESREKSVAIIKLQECIMWATESVIVHDRRITPVIQIAAVG